MKRYHAVGASNTVDAVAICLLHLLLVKNSLTYNSLERAFGGNENPQNIGGDRRPGLSKRECAGYQCYMVM
jgi:hypothetical protein